MEHRKKKVTGFVTFFLAYNIGRMADDEAI